MADGSGGGGGAAVGVVVGALLAVVLVVGFFAMRGGLTDTRNINLNVHAPPITAPVAPAAPGK